MACCNEQPTTNNCEQCTEIVLSDCVMYKGFVTNNMGLTANFRLKQFIEGAIAKLNTISELNVDKFVTSLNFVRSGHTLSVSATRSDNTVINSPSVSLTSYLAKLYYSPHSIAVTAASTPFVLLADTGSTLNLSHGHQADVAGNRIVTNNTSNARQSGIKITVEGRIRVPSVTEWVYLDILQNGVSVYEQYFHPTNNTFLPFTFSFIPASANTITPIVKGTAFTLRFRAGVTTNTDTSIACHLIQLSMTAEELIV